MSLVMYAKNELARLDMDEDGMQETMNNHILHMVEEFAKEGHSGFSANYAIAVLRRLLQFKPLSALTGEDDEWTEVADGVFQNKRCSAVFKRIDRNDGKPYYLEGKIFSNDGGETWFTNGDSRVFIEFPFVVPDEPEKIYLKKRSNK